MTPAAITLIVFLVALGLFIADFLPMGLMVFMVPVALYFCGVIEAKEIFAPLVGQSIILVVAMVRRRSTRRDRTETARSGPS